MSWDGEEVVSVRVPTMQRDGKSDPLPSLWRKGTGLDLQVQVLSWKRQGKRVIDSSKFVSDDAS
jgi:hypothetical protein